MYYPCKLSGPHCSEMFRSALQEASVHSEGSQIVRCQQLHYTEGVYCNIATCSGLIITETTQAQNVHIQNCSTSVFLAVCYTRVFYIICTERCVHVLGNVHWFTFHEDHLGHMPGSSLCDYETMRLCLVGQTCLLRVFHLNPSGLGGAKPPGVQVLVE